MQNDQIETFIRETEKVRHDYKGIEARIIAHNWKGVWVNVGSRFVFSTQQKAQTYKPKKWIEKDPEICLLQKTEPMDAFDQFVDVFREGELTIDGKTIIYKRWTNQDWGSAYSPSFNRLRRSDPEDWSTSKVFAYSLRGSESYSSDRERNEIRSRLESKLSRLRTPFVSFGDFARDFLGPIWMSDAWYNPFAEFLAPIDVCFATGYELQERKATSQCDMAMGYQPSEIRVGYVDFLGDKALRRGTVDITPLKERDDGKRTFAATINVSKDSEKVVLLLLYRGEEVDRLVLHRVAVHRKNPRMLLHAQTDPQFEKFNAGVAARDRKGQDQFERSILLLFHFLGFSSVSPPSSSDSVDLMAFTEDPTRVLLVECTTGSPGLRDKLGKLASRRAAYKRSVPFTRPVAILATSLEKEDIGPSDLERASQEGIITLAAEDIRTLVSMANQGRTIGSVMYYLRRIAPSSANMFPFP